MPPAVSISRRCFPDCSYIFFFLSNQTERNLTKLDFSFSVSTEIFLKKGEGRKFESRKPFYPLRVET